jgi:actin-related protein
MSIENLTNKDLLKYHSLLEGGSKRFQNAKEKGLETKFLYHVVRLLYEAEMIMNEGDIDLQRHREHLKSIRRAEVTEEEIRQWASEKEKGLEKGYNDSKLQNTPDEAAIKQLLLNCFEEHYGNLENCVVIPEAAAIALQQIQEVLDRYGIIPR